MGLLSRLFGGKRAAANEASAPKVTEFGEVDLSSGLIRLEVIDLFGPFAKSASGEWMVVWSDADSSQGVGGHRMTGHGRYALFNLRTQTVAVQGALERPNNGRVANNGSFLIEEWHFGSEMSGTLFVFLASGEKLLQRHVNANIFNSDISADGNLAVMQTCNGPNSDANLLIFFNLESRSELFAFPPHIGWADGYQFEKNPIRLFVSKKHLGSFRYDGTGRFLDEKNYWKACLNSEDLHATLRVVGEKLKTDSLQKNEAEEALVALKSKKFQSDQNDIAINSTALRYLGQIYENQNNLNAALLAYENALKLNPKVGVKPRIALLKKKMAIKDF
jgi:Tetratricopeptide repeat